MSNLYDGLTQAANTYKSLYEVCLEFEKDVEMKYKNKEVQLNTGQRGTIKDIMLYGDGTACINVIIDDITIYVDSIKDVKLL